jgi:hypothetical protein
VNRSSGCIRTATDVTIVVVERNSLASGNIETSSTSLREADSKDSRSVLILDDDSDSSDGSDSGIKGYAGRCADRHSSMSKATQEGR